MGMRKASADGITYSVATLVNDHSQYDSMLASFRQHGFDASSCEFLHVDNTRPEPGPRKRKGARKGRPALA